MTVNTTAKADKATGAASHKPVEWQAIDWQKAHRTVRRLQVGIVKAMQAGRWGKVKALQHRLTHFHSQKLEVAKPRPSPGVRKA